MDDIKRERSDSIHARAIAMRSQSFKLKNVEIEIPVDAEAKFEERRRSIQISDAPIETTDRRSSIEFVVVSVT